MNASLSSPVDPILTFDIGGTHFRCAVVQANQIIEVRKLPSPSFYQFRNLSGEELVDRLVQLICGMIEDFENRHPHLSGVALAVPGLVTHHGVVVSAPPLWGDLISKVPLQSVIQARTRLKVTVFNDLCGTALFYSQLPSFSEGVDFVTVITLSTGVGSKTVDVKQKRVLLDAGGMAGEIGHVIVDFSENATPCDCGGKGHLSSYLSGRGLAQFIRSKKRHDPDLFDDCGISLTSDDVVVLQSFAEAVHNHDARAWDILNFSAARLAFLIHVISGTFAVDRYVLVGNVAHSLGEDLRTAVNQHLADIGVWGWDKSRVAGLIHLGIPDDNIGLLGAAKYGATRLGLQS